MNKKVLILLLFNALFVLPNLYSQNFVYKPKNPAFGGESFNYQWLQSSADAQNSFSDEDDDEENSELEDFADDLNRQLLSRINRLLLDGQFDLNGDLQPGVYTYGSLSVEIFESTEGLVVNILDTSNGEQTQVIIPN
ncbi:curli assembly protein CsgF [Pseudofulvibacter geojedonensis]|uniref:Curli production assembly/transport component CsgF n=1 Tax=Pseudofulvibacter geojedonensis TaxID=1123758 RepID=A0ABW3I3D9_9FLAO